MRMSQKIDEMLGTAYKKDEPGAAVIVVNDGKVLFRKGLGMANLELGVPIKPEMIFRIGSVTKQFTSAAIMMLAEQGKLSVHDNVTRFLPDYPVHGKTITVEHLLTHTSGIKNITSMTGYLSKRMQDLTVEYLIDSFKSEPLEFNPGDKWEYSNSGYILLGAIIEKVSGKSYSNFIQQNIFDPLEMKHSHYGSHSRIIPDRVSGYDKEPNGFVNAAYLSMTQPYAAGSLLSSVDDLALWDAALCTERLLKKKSLDQIFTPFKLNNGDSTWYGYGWGILEYDGHVVVWHDGGINGFLSYVLRMPEDRTFVAILSNNPVAELGPAYLAGKIAALVIGKPFKEPTAIKVHPRILDAYVGVYRIDEKANYAITKEGDRLFAQRTGMLKMEVLAESETDFFYKNSFARIRFVRNHVGEVVSMTMFYMSSPRQTASKTGDAPPSERHAVQIDPSVYASYVGRYELVPGYIITVTREGDKLMVHVTNMREKLQLFPESETKFFLNVVDAQIEFVKDDEGKVTQLILHQAGLDRSARKMNA